MAMFSFAFFATLAHIAIVIAQNTTTPATTGRATYGCVTDASYSALEGNYSKYRDKSGYSIFIKQAIGETYVIYFESSLSNGLQGFGFYRCESEDLYLGRVEEQSQQSPANVEFCQGTPLLFCPPLEDASSVLRDGAGIDVANYVWYDVPDFYECLTWFSYSDDATDVGSGSVTFTHSSYCANPSSGNDNGGNVVVGPGDKTSTQTDVATKKKMSPASAGVLWTFVSVFLIVCIVAISVFAYKYKQKQKAEEDPANAKELMASKSEMGMKAMGSADSSNQLQPPADLVPEDSGQTMTVTSA